MNSALSDAVFGCRSILTSTLNIDAVYYVGFERYAFFGAWHVVPKEDRSADTESVDDVVI